MNTKSKFTPVLIVLALLAALGGCAWTWQLVRGLGITGMNNAVSWGLYISLFMLFVGLSAGGLIVASSASVFGVSAYKSVSFPAVLLSTVCIITATIFVFVDMGGPQRLWHLLVYPNFTSPLTWDVAVITVYLAINIIYIALMSARKPDMRKIKIVSSFALPAAILVHSVTAWIFGLMIAKTGWYSALMAPLFVVSALDSGLALLLLALIVLNRWGVFAVERQIRSSLAGFLAVCVAIDAFLVFCEVLTMGYPGAGEAKVLHIMLSGQTALFFWLEVVCLVVPFLLLAPKQNREKTGIVVLSSALVIVGVFGKRLWLLLSSFLAFNVAGAPGVTLGNPLQEGIGNWAVAGAYFPTLPEVCIATSIVAASILVYMLLTRRFLSRP
jgi:molybdopterin-containing oxidoreductase family membrane subunit